MSTHIFYYIFGIASILSIYHFLIFIGRRKDLSNFYFFLFSLSVSLMVLTHKLLPLANVKGKILFISQTLVTLFIVNSFTLFVGNVFNLKEMKKILIFAITGLYISFLFFVYLFLKYQVSLNKYYFVLLIYSFIIFPMFLFIMFKKNKLKNNKKGILVFCGIIPFIISSLIMAGVQTVSIRLPYGLNYSGYIIMMIFFAYALTDGFNKEHYELLNLTRTLDQKVREQTNKLREEKETKENFFINLAHETRNPLTLIDNYLNKYIKLHGTNEEMNIIKQNVKKLKDDICNYLDVEKIRQGQILYNHYEIIELNRFIEQKVNIFRATASRKNIIIDHKKRSSKLYLKADPFALDRILNNLITNAFKFSFEDSKIEIGCKINSYNLIELYIKDYGVGIPQDKLQNIFEPYYKIQNNDNTGIGMGLFIIKKIIDELNGKIEVESALNTGTTFKILLNKYELKESDKVISNYFQVIDSISNDYTTKKPLDESYIKSHDTILIIEDDINLLIYLQSEFANSYNVFVATDGLDALNKLKSMPVLPNLIISDIMMKNLTGNDFLAKIRENTIYQGIPVIFLTAKTDMKDKIKYLQSGAIDFISKPFNIVELKAKVKTILENYKMQRDNNLNEFENKIIKVLRSTYFNNTNPINDVVRNKLNNLPEAKRRILKLVLQGKIYKEIGSELKIKEGTIRKSMSEIYTYFEVNNQIELIQKIFNYNPDIFNK